MAELIGGLAGSLQGTVNSAVSGGQNFLDKIISPERRAELWARIQKFIQEKPMLASFIASHIALSGPAIGIFVIFTITVAVFSLIAALLIGLLIAVLFIAAAIGFALIILLPVVFFTTFAASFLWLWGVGAYYLLKWLNQKEIPGINVPFVSGAMDSFNEYTRGEQEHEAPTNDIGKTRIEGERDEIKEEYMEDMERDRAQRGNDKGSKELKKQEKKPPGASSSVPKAADGGADVLGMATGVHLDSTPVNGVTNVTKVNGAGDVTKKVGSVKKGTEGVTKKVPGDPAKKLDGVPGVGQVKGITGL